MKYVAALVTLACLSIVSPAAQAQDCNAVAPDTVTNVALPGAPFSVIPTRDGCTVFVALSGPSGGRIGVMRRSGGRLTLAHEVKLPSGQPAGMRLSPDGQVLAASNGEGVVLYDAAKLAAGDTPPLAVAKSEPSPRGGAAGSVYVGISPDNKLLFVSDEQVEAITVYDLPRLRGGDTKPIGRIPVARAPVGLVFSPDGRTLYTTSEIALPSDNVPATCGPPLGAPPGIPNSPPGLLYVIDVAAAGRAPAESIRAKVEAGCDPVRIELSRDGSKAYVTTRSANALAVFDTTRLVRDGVRARIATIPTGILPVGVIVAPNHVVVGNSNRLDPNSKAEWLSVIDPASNQVIGNIPAGGFPREMAVTADGKTLLVGNFASQNMTIVNLAGLTPAYFAAQKTAKAADDALRARAAADLQARIASGQASPGFEAALRKFIADLQAGTPNYAGMVPPLANAVQNSMTQSQQRLKDWGPLQSVTFSTIAPNGANVFFVTFGTTRTRWTINLDATGIITGLGFGPAPAQ